MKKHQRSGPSNLNTLAPARRGMNTGRRRNHLGARMIRTASFFALFTLAAPAVVSAQGIASLEVGTSMTGTLSSDDPAHPMRPAQMDPVKLPLSVGDAVTVSLTSEDFDTYLYVVAPDGALVAEDDDGGGGLNSSVSFVATADGLYTVQVTSYGAATGDWTLEAAPWSVQPWSFAPLAVGTSVDGALDAAVDPTVGDRLGDGLALDLSAGQGVRLHVGSDAFDARVEVLAPSGSSIAFDDDGGGGTDAAVTFTAPVDGTYHAIVTAWQQHAEGPWTATLTEAGSASEPGRNLSALVSALAPTPLPLGDRVAGELNGDDLVHPERGAPADAWTIRLDAPGGYTFGMRSNDIDGWLQLLDADGRVIAESDDADGVHPVIEATLQAGEYTLVATAWGPSAGAYAILALDDGARLAGPEPLQHGTRVDGTIVASGPTSAHNGHSAVRYRLDVAAGEVWQVTAASQALDMYLVARDAGGAELAFDDDGGGGTNSQLQLAMPADMSITIEVTTYDGRTGPFVVAATRRSP